MWFTCWTFPSSNFSTQCGGVKKHQLLCGEGRCLGLLLGGLLGEEDCVDVGEHTASGNGHLAQQLAQLLVVTDSQLDVARDDASLLVVPVGEPHLLEIEA